MTDTTERLLASARVAAQLLLRPDIADHMQSVWIDEGRLTLRPRAHNDDESTRSRAASTVALLNLLGHTWEHWEHEAVPNRVGTWFHTWKHEAGGVEVTVQTNLPDAADPLTATDAADPLAQLAAGDPQ